MAVSPVLRRIRPLDPLLANQIAAGEVVERPASVVKELLENSLDAGAKSIQLEVEQGGVALIRVRDDGSGICRDDLTLALARHATSKIYDQRELMQVLSLGFRGEALASIASVSRLDLSSRHRSEEHGWRISSTTEPVPQPHPVGTTVEVRDLFYNTPARRKFLRSERTELEHVSEVVRRIALSRHDVSLSLQHNQRQLLQVRPATERSEQERRVAAICGRAFMEGARYLEFEVAGLRLWGWLVQPERARPQADLQYFYINGRIIRDRVVTHALRLAYGDALPPGRHPAYVLYLEMDPTQVDVNVHPTKHEVRFREVRHVHDFLYRALREAVGEGDGSAASITVPETVREPAEAYVAAVQPVAPGGLVAADMRIVGVVLGRYLLVEDMDVVRLIDLRAARAHQTAVAMQASLRHGGCLRAQPLLLPQQVEVSTHQQELLNSHAELLLRLGFELDVLGPGQMVLRQVPVLLRQVALQPLMAAVLEGLAQLTISAAEQAPVLAALAECVRRHGPLPERQEWPGLVAAMAADGETSGVVLELTADDLSVLLQRGTFSS